MGKPFRLPPISRWPFLPSVGAIGLLLCLIMLVLDWNRIVTLAFRDPDDALRYVEVRDFLAGQGWFDVSQHRINPPTGGPMHWSRLVDLPIAALMLLFRPLFGVPTADRIALVLVPLMLTCALVYMVALATRRLAGPGTALFAAALIALCVPLLIQFTPTRIDHHNWQIVMAAIAAWAVFNPQSRRGGWIAGLAVAFWSHVSSEGLPYAALFGAAFALCFLRDARNRDGIIAYLGALAVAATAFLIGTRGWPEAANPYCDAVSPVYLFPIITAAVVMPVACIVIGTSHWIRRAASPAIAAVAAAIVYLSIAGVCRGGPFETLDPVVYNLWYLHVAEGRPFWEQSPFMAVVVAGPPLVGLIGGLLAARAATDANGRFRWLLMLLLSAGAYAVSLMVMRAMSVAYVLALPGMAWLILMLLPKAQGLSSALARILATVSLTLLTPIGLSAVAAIVVPDAADDGVDHQRTPAQQAVGCTDNEKLAGLAALPAGIILAPLDIGPYLLAFTPHSVIATAHHRNHLAMRDTILAFTETTDQARVIVAQHKAAYVAYCPNRNEVNNYTLKRPHAFMTALETGKVPTWLQPVPMRPGETIRVYRVITPVSTSPR